MGTWVVDSDWYFLTAAILGRAGSKVAGAAGVVSGASHGSGHFAGNDPVGTKWGSRYDGAARDALGGADSLAQAWSSLAGRIYQAGVNHAWAEFHAGRRKIPVPANLPARPAISEPTSTISSSVGANGVGLADIIPGLVESVGKETPNADTKGLDAASDTWQRFATTVGEAVSDVVNQVRRPDRDMPDATAFYETITNLSAPADAVAADGRTLEALTRSFSAATHAMRANIAAEVNSTAMWMGGAASVVVLSSEVTGGASFRAVPTLMRWRLNQAGTNIRTYIAAVETAATAIDSVTVALDPAKKGLLDRQKLVDIEIYDPDSGTTRRTRVPLSKELAWERYKERGGQWDWNRWSKTYDQLKANAANGWVFDKYAAEVMGYSKDDGWHSQYSDQTIVPGRRWDWVSPDLNEFIENKSGRLDMDQLAKDERVLALGHQLTYNLNANYPYSPAEIAALQRLQDRYPDQFTVNRL